MASTFSDDQLAKIMQMQDFTTEEAKLQQQIAQANQLRAVGMQPSSGRHWTRQAARGLQGIGGALGDYQNEQRMNQISADRRTALRGMFPEMNRQMLGQRPGQLALLDEDETGFRRSANYG